MPDQAIQEAIDEGVVVHPRIKEYADELVDMDQGPPNIRYINVYIVERNYGGPEEGGWWYDSGTPEGVSIVCNTISALEMQDLYELMLKRYPRTGSRFSMAPIDDDFEVRIETHPPKEWPEERPYYE